MLTSWQQPSAWRFENKSMRSIVKSVRSLARLPLRHAKFMLAAQSANKPTAPELASKGAVSYPGKWLEHEAPSYRQDVAQRFEPPRDGKKNLLAG